MWTRTSGTIQHLGAPPFVSSSPPTLTYTACPNAVSSPNAGAPTIVGGARDVLGQVDAAFYWTQGTGFRLFDAPYNELSADGVSTDGNLAVGFGDNPALDGLLWRKQGATFQIATALPSTIVGQANNSGQAHALSGDGFSIVGNVPGVGGMVRWSGSGYSSVSVLSTGIGSALAANRDGSVVVGFSGSQAAYWDGSLRTMSQVLTDAGAPASQLAGWALQSARGISLDAKVVVGDGTFNGTSRSWIARLP
jgi:hypothetical protein